MTPRFRFALFGLVAAFATAAPGCNDSFNAGPIGYADGDQLVALKGGKPKLYPAVRGAMDDLFGADPQHIKVPAGSGLPAGGAYLADYKLDKVGGEEQVRPIAYTDAGGAILKQEGGYALYRRHCLHCHGVAGGGDGPTASFLYPRPRDYRPGLFKFTSTTNGQKPTRDDLRKTLLYGLHGTSMPAFEALLTKGQIEQVIDYLIFLSARGETERALAAEADTIEEAEVDKPEFKDGFAATAAEIAGSVFKKWTAAEGQVVKALTPRVPPTRDSVERGRALFLGLNKTGNKVECAGCHGPQAKGNGPSFIDEDLFKKVAFGGNPSDLPERVKTLLDDKQREAWKNSLDDWGNPLRPNNLNLGVYKGGRRPIDLYWRLAKGINGAKMPAHYPLIEPDRIWDLVNFVLALPYDPELLRDAKLPEAAKPAAAAVASH